MVRRGLIISYYFPPTGGGGVQRWSKFVKYLSRQNWQFDIITSTHSSNEIDDSTLLKDIPESTNILRVSDKFSNHQSKFKSTYLKRFFTSFLFVTDSRKYWVKKAWQKVISKLSENEYDVVICSIPPYSISELAVRIIESNTNIPVVLDMRDPWTINPYKIYPSPFHKLMDKRKEYKIIYKLDHIISAYQSTLDFYKNEIPSFEERNHIVISNGFDEDDFMNLKSGKLPNPDYFNIAFSGTFYSHLNNPDIFFKSLAILKDEGIKMNFHHIGSSVYDIEKLAKKYGIDDIVIRWGYRAHKECLEILNAMDAFVFILDSRIQNADKTIGGKVYEYLRFKKPILGMVPANGEAAKLLRGTKSGIVCDSSEVMKIVESIKELKSAKFYFNEIDKYSRENLTRRLNNYLTNLI